MATNRGQQRAIATSGTGTPKQAAWVYSWRGRLTQHKTRNASGYAYGRLQWVTKATGAATRQEKQRKGRGQGKGRQQVNMDAAVLATRLQCVFCNELGCHGSVGELLKAA